MLQSAFHFDPANSVVLNMLAHQHLLRGEYSKVISTSNGPPALSRQFCNVRAFLLAFPPTPEFAQVDSLAKAALQLAEMDKTRANSLILLARAAHAMRVHPPPPNSSPRFVLYARQSSHLCLPTTQLWALLSSMGSPSLHPARPLVAPTVPLPFPSRHPFIALPLPASPLAGEQKFPEAATHYQQAARLDETLALPHFGLAQMNLRNNEFKNAISELEAVLQAAPYSIDAARVCPRPNPFSLTAPALHCSPIFLVGSFAVKLPPPHLCLVAPPRFLPLQLKSAPSPGLPMEFLFSQ